MGRVLAYVAVGGDLDLLPHVLRHYRELDVERILLDVHAGPHETSPVPEGVEDLARSFGAEVAHVFRGAYDGLRRRREATLARHARPDDWVIVSDLDELPEYRTAPRDLARHCEARGYDYVMGELVDRVATDGGFPSIDQRPLWEQYPVAVKLTGNVCGGQVTKVTLTRPWVRLVEGQHQALEGVPCPLTDHYVPVHHFKWDARVFARCRAMMAKEIRPVAPAGNRWRRRERERLLRYVEAQGGRLDLRDPLLAAYLPAYRRDPAALADSRGGLPCRAETTVDPEDPEGRRPLRIPGASLSRCEAGYRLDLPGGEERWLLEADATWEHAWRLATGDLTLRQILVCLAEELPGSRAELAASLAQAMTVLCALGALSVARPGPPASLRHPGSCHAS